VSVNVKLGHSKIIIQFQATESSKSPMLPILPNSNLPPYRVEIETILGPVRLVTPKNDFLALESG